MISKTDAIELLNAVRTSVSDRDELHSIEVTIIRRGMIGKAPYASSETFRLPPVNRTAFAASEA